MASSKIHIIACEECNWPTATKMSNTMRCQVCQLINSTEFVGDRPTKCLSCEERFIPLRRGDRLCGKCVSLHDFRATQGHCNSCGEDPVVCLSDDLAVCYACATERPKRDWFRNALYKKRNSRRTATPEHRAAEQARLEAKYNA